MMRYCGYSILLIILATFCGGIYTAFAAENSMGSADDTLSARPPVISAVDDNYSQARTFSGFVYQNPAIKKYQFEHSLTELYLQGDFRNEDLAFVVQQGDKAALYGINAGSYIHLSPKSTVWGGASYNAGKKKNILWNSSSDYSVIAPYITLDSVGGDMHSEQYTFSGGYNHQFGKAAFGIEADFRALHEYRDYDPRPRNIVLDLNASLGGSLALGANYIAALSFRSRVYKQTGDVSFYNERGDGPQELFMTGLGTHNTGLADKSASVYYQGGTLGASLELMPLSRRGFFVRMAYDHFSFERIANNFNKFPTNKLIDQNAVAQIAYIRGSRLVWGIKGKFIHNYKEGVNNIVGEKTSQENPIVGSFTMYHNRMSDASLHLIIGGETGSISWSAEPYVSYKISREEYIYPAHLMKTNHIRAGVQLNFVRRWDKWRFDTSLDGAYCNSGDGELVIQVANMKPFLVDMSRYIYGRHSSDYTALALDVRVDRLLKNNLGLFLAARWQRDMFEHNKSADRLNIKLGITF